MSVTVSGFDFKDTVFDSEERHIESATTEIENEHIAFALSLLVETVSDSSSGGLINDTLDVEASDLTSILGSLTLRVVEIGGHSDNSVLDSSVKVSFSDFLHLDENHRRNFFSLELLLLSLELNTNHGLFTGAGLNLERPELNVLLDDLVTEFTADETLSIEDGVGGVSGSLVLCSITDETLLFGEGNVGGGSVDTLIVGDDFNFVVLEHTDAGVGGS